MISPCVKICKVKKGICIGCGRSLEQIKYWSNYSNFKRKKIIKQLKNNSSNTKLHPT